MTDDADGWSDPLIPTYRNLAGVASYHFDPVFAQAALRAIDHLRPDVVALELPNIVASELEWAAGCWPGPVVSLSGNVFFPFVPGDSIFEAYREARQRSVPIHLIDLLVPTSQRGEHDHGGTIRIGPEFAPRLGPLFRETVAAAVAMELPTNDNLARETFMAKRLADLMAQFKRVLWVGGMAHWEPITRRLAENDFSPQVERGEPKVSYRRMRLSPTALYRMTARIPWLVTAYGKSSESFDDAVATRAMALEALKPSEDSQVFLINPSAISTEDPDEWQREIPGTVADVARALNYARNLALTDRFCEKAELAELLMAAANTVGSRYAGSLYKLAMLDAATPETAHLPNLTWEQDQELRVEGYRSGDEWITAEPWSRPPGSVGVISLVEVERREREIPHKDLPAAETGEKTYWGAYPWEEHSYEAFVSYVLRRASMLDVEEAPSTKFVSGLRDGLDARETIRHWRDGDLYVKESRRGHMRVTNGVIDWTSDHENSDVLTGRSPGGWIDPGCRHVGSVSRELNSDGRIIQRDPFLLQHDYREISFVSLDSPTTTAKGAPNPFYTDVILPLVKIRGSQSDNLYGWLAIMFSFCEGKRVVYYSRYVPSDRVRSVAQAHSIELVYRPLQTIPRQLLDRHQKFRFLSMSPSQWKELYGRIAKAKGSWR